MRRIDNLKDFLEAVGADVGMVNDHVSALTFFTQERCLGTEGHDDVRLLEADLYEAVVRYYARVLR